jgi:hypothetical protein
VRACHTSAAGIKDLLNPFPSSQSRAEFPTPISLTSSTVALYSESNTEEDSANSRQIAARTEDTGDRLSMKEVVVEVTSSKDHDSVPAVGPVPETDFTQLYRNGHIPFEFEKNSKDEVGEVEGERNPNIAVGADAEIDREGREGLGEGRGYIAGVRERPAGPLTADSFYLDMFKTMCDSVSIGTCCVC